MPHSSAPTGGVLLTDHQVRALVKASSLAPSVRTTVLAAADRLDRGSGIIALGIDGLASMLGIKRRAAQRRIRAAERAGAIVVVDPGGGAGRVARYRLGPALFPENKGVADDTVPQGNSVAGDADKGVVCDAKGRRPRPKRAAQTTPVQENKEPNNTTKGERGGGDAASSSRWEGTADERDEAVRQIAALGHNRPDDFAQRAGDASTVAYIVDQAKDAERPAGLAETLLRGGVRPPTRDGGEGAPSGRRTVADMARCDPADLDPEDIAQLHRLAQVGNPAAVAWCEKHSDATADALATT